METGNPVEERSVGGCVARLEKCEIPPPFDGRLGDSPLLSLVRMEWLSWHHRRLTAAVAPHWPLPGDSKSLRACISEGLLPGLQGMHARLLFGMRDSQEVDLDALIPYSPSVPDREVILELEGWGMKEEIAGPLVAELCKDMGEAAVSVSLLRQELTRNLVESCLPAHGTLSLLPLRGSSNHIPAQLLVVYQPDCGSVRRHLEPVRAATPLPATPFYGPLNIPLYSSYANPDVSRTLAAAGVAATPFTAALLLNHSHFLKLALLYRLTAAGVTDPAKLPAPGSEGCLLLATCLPSSNESSSSCPPERALFIQRLFCLLARYEAFSGNTGGIQGAIPHHVFDGLEAACGVSGECFASPLNCHHPRFFSAFPDTDAHFGGCGSFFKAAITEGAFEANPPFVNGFMKCMVLRLRELLDAARGAGKPLLFFVIVPSWTDAYFFKLLTGSLYKLASERLVRKEHEYIDGLQHRAGRSTWGANVDSTWFLLATSAAVERYSLSPGTFTKHLRQCFAQTTKGLGEARRSFKYSVHAQTVNDERMP